MKKKLAMIVAPALSAAAIAVAGSGPASASDAETMAYTCQDNEVCFYQHANFSGSVFVPDEMKNGSYVRSFEYRNFYNGTRADNAVSSIKNNTGWLVCVYDQPGAVKYLATVEIDNDIDFSKEAHYANDAVTSASYCYRN
ncbi:peptidase inhibitor family I36 protein [Streptomyces cadmiisoli]|uniref:peptidase inhibitor family I36 protein n=1 Tax=Streptomyces cadmiisoli TaxID=2184053 RepID=UPI003654F88F